MVQQPLDVLESRVSEMIEQMKTLRSEKTQLQAEMSKQEKAFQKLKEERHLIRNRIEKILGTLNHADGKDAPK